MTLWEELEVTMNNLKEIFFDRRYIKVSVFVIFTVIALYVLYSLLSHTGTILSGIGSGLWEILSAIRPLIFGLIFAYFLSPLVNVIDNKLFKMSTNSPEGKIRKKFHNSKRTFSIVISFFSVFIALALVVFTFYSMLVGKFTSEKLTTMVTNITGYFTKYQEFFAELTKKLEESGLASNIKDPLASFVDWASSGLVPEATSNISSYLSNIGGSLLTVVLGMVVGFYILKDQTFFMKLWKSILAFILPNNAEGKLMEILQEIHIVISNFFRGQLLAGLIVGILSSIGLTVIGIDFAIFIGMFAGVANIIPYFGPILGMIPAVLIALLDGNFTLALLAILVLFAIQQIDSIIISPRIVGSSVGLHPVFVLLSVTIGGRYLGILGMLIAVPIAAIIKLFINKYATYFNERKVNTDNV